MSERNVHPLGTGFLTVGFPCIIHIIVFQIWSSHNTSGSSFLKRGWSKEDFITHSEKVESKALVIPAASRDIGVTCYILMLRPAFLQVSEEV